MHKRFSVRRLGAADLDRILDIEHASFGKDSYDRNLFADFFHKCGGLFLVAEHGGNIWGYMITCTGGRDRRRAELVSVAVDPVARGQGAASALMDSTLRRLRRRGIARFTLMVKVTNRKAQTFYAKYGFEKVRIVPRYYAKRGDAWLMAKSLP